MKKFNETVDYFDFEDCQYFLEQMDKLCTGLRSEENMAPFDIEITPS